MAKITLRNSSPRPARAFATLAVLLAASCAAPAPRFPLRPPLARDADRRPFAAKLDSYFSPYHWDQWDTAIFRPVSQFFAVRPGGEAANVNALDEVPDSSWFENRVGDLTPEDAGLGPCRPPFLDGSGPWHVIAGKPDGASSGFIVSAPDEQRYLVKFDRGLQSPRALIADIAGSKLFHAAGFGVPCNRAVDFDPSILTIAPDAEVERDTGEKVPMTWAHVARALERVPRLPDGRARGIASRFLEGRPLGPWRYHGTREGDRNDIIPHEDRRELRGARLLAAWTGHWDQREQNTLAMWKETSNGMGFVEHYLLDFGDCFGAMGSSAPQNAWRRGHAYWFDAGQILSDFFTLGIVERPWDRARLGPSGLVFAYYDVDEFDPEGWKTRRPNAAFSRMTERDAAWMARIIARIDRPRLEAMVRDVPMSEPLRSELLRILVGRRAKILRRYLERLSPLTDPQLRPHGGRVWLCTTDLGLRAGSAIERRAYAARAWSSRGSGTSAALPVELALRAADEPCVLLPRAAGANRSNPAYWIVEIRTGRAPALPYPARFHLYQTAELEYVVVGLERPESFDPPR
jgi:hypothetical protein